MSRGGAFAQWSYFGADVAELVNRRWGRLLVVWTAPSVWVLLSYRFDRFMFLLLGDSWRVLRVFFFPLFLLFRILGTDADIHYRADIGPGANIQHPGLGVVISGEAVVGARLTMTGGNCIGIRRSTDARPFIVGDDVSLGANAMIIGPVTVGDHVKVGAGAVVISDIAAGTTVVGVPARPVALG